MKAGLKASGTEKGATAVKDLALYGEESWLEIRCPLKNVLSKGISTP